MGPDASHGAAAHCWQKERNRGTAAHCIGGLFVTSAVTPSISAWRRPADGGARRPPIPREQLVELVSRMLGDASEDVGEPGLRVDVVHLGRDDEGVHGGGALTAAIGAGEHPRLPAESDAAKAALGGV